jgi:hypothetical protein
VDGFAARNVFLIPLGRSAFEAVLSELHWLIEHRALKWFERFTDLERVVKLLEAQEERALFENRDLSSLPFTKSDSCAGLMVTGQLEDRAATRLPDGGR